jgi:hypothetical protein
MKLNLVLIGKEGQWDFIPFYGDIRISYIKEEKIKVDEKETF